MNMNDIIGTHNILFITIDSLRYDAADTALKTGKTPNLKKRLPGNVWEKRLTPACFTLPAHFAFFSGFLPTPISEEIEMRLYASQFLGSESISDQTFVFEEANLIEALSKRGYRTACIGGVGFFNKMNQLGRVLPGFFQESYWDKSLGVTEKKSTENQVSKALSIIDETDDNTPLCLFINISATHQPTCIYSEGRNKDSVETQIDALHYVDSCLDTLFQNMKKTFCIICSDHGTAFGEDGFTGHRLPHAVVNTVPYAHFIL